MTDPDEKVRRRYRELAREEPGAELDAAILAASRRALGRPSFSRRWGAPLSIAAVFVLAVGVSLNMQVERPGVEYAEPARPVTPPAPQLAPVPEPPVREPATPVPAPAKPQRKRAEALAPQALQRSSPEAPALAKEAAPAAGKNERALADSAADRAAPQPFPSIAATAPAPPPAAPAPAAAPEPAAAPAVAQEDARAASGRREAREAFASKPAFRAESPQDDPVRELERIARLRTAGRHADADKALDEFRRRHPGYRIPDPTWERVKPPSR